MQWLLDSLLLIWQANWAKKLRRPYSRISLWVSFSCIKCEWWHRWYDSVIWISDRPCDIYLVAHAIHDGAGLQCEKCCLSRFVGYWWFAPALCTEKWSPCFWYWVLLIRSTMDTHFSVCCLSWLTCWQYFIPLSNQWVQQLQRCACKIRLKSGPFYLGA